LRHRFSLRNVGGPPNIGITEISRQQFDESAQEFRAPVARQRECRDPDLLDLRV
jgi:hypothetical protein